MLKVFNTYDPRANVANSNYPDGSYKDRSVPGATDGTPIDAQRFNDILGGEEALIAQARIEKSGTPDTALVSDRADAARIVSLLTKVTADLSESNDVIYVGLDITTVEYVVDRNSLTVWSTSSASGTVTADDLNTSTGVLSGVVGTLTRVKMSTREDFSNAIGNMGQTFTANATFTSVDNVISMVGIVTAFDLEVGDVIQFSNADTNNNKARTVEVITDNDTIVVNYEHCGGRGNGLLKLTDETVTGATVKLLSKWNVARDGLGQAWVDVKSFRAFNTTLNAPLKRSIEISAARTNANNVALNAYADGVLVGSEGTTSSGDDGASVNFSCDGVYVINVAPLVAITFWSEKR